VIHFSDIKDGQIIFINSIAGHRIFTEGRMVFYNASKLALTCVVEGWRREVVILHFVLKPLANFIDILQAAFAPVFLSQKMQDQTVI